MEGWKRYWKGALIGFLFGTIGLWLLAAFSLAFAPIEALSGPLMAPGRALSGLVAPSGSAGSGIVLVLMLFNGLLYALVGILVQLALSRPWRRA